MRQGDFANPCARRPLWRGTGRCEPSCVRSLCAAHRVGAESVSALDVVAPIVYRLAMAKSDGEHLRELFKRVHAVIRKIPRGTVATYGQVAELAGIPGGARVAAAALKTSKPGDRLPWQRVIGKASKLRGRIAIHDPVGAAIQRKLLEAERVAIGETGLIPLDVYGWLPADGARAKRSVESRIEPRAESVRGASPRRQPRSVSKRRASSSRR
jgi:methylated-DNA-protein-cysteine methyltransferase-like protein